MCMILQYKNQMVIMCMILQFTNHQMISYYVPPYDSTVEKFCSIIKRFLDDFSYRINTKIIEKFYRTITCE